MGTERPHKDEIFNAAAEIRDVDERASYIAEACEDDAALRAEIEELLKHDNAEDSLFDRSAPGLGATLDIPLGHANAAYVRSHFDAITVSVADAPRAGEIVFVLAMAKGPRVHSRMGGLEAWQVKGEDGLR